MLARDSVTHPINQQIPTKQPEFEPINHQYMK